MLTHGRLGLRRGVTLVELLVTIVVGGIALTLIARICLRQQRIFTDLADAAAVSGQLREGSTILPIDLGSASAAGNDFREARDTSIELRATIASAVVCDTMGGRIVLAPNMGGASTYAGAVSGIQPGDSTWLFVPSGSSDGWKPFGITAVTGAAAGACAASGPVLADSSRLASRIALTLDSAASATWIGAPLRVTRAVRYSLYRSSDGSWYLGQRDWNAAALRFNTVQPVSGPYLSPASGGLVFRYRDSAGAPLPIPVPDPRAIALIQVDLRSQTKQAPRAVAAATSVGARIDSVSTWLLVRNRR